ncbi:MAG: hypothetical protein P4L69_11325 [Desulfosporosinus sp.]|nr:hypothetical protein [Desulfosporosinus sp.]
MRYSTGLSDSLFGEKITLQGSDEKGNIVKLKVTKKWLDQAQGEGKPSSPKQVSELVEIRTPTHKSGGSGSAKGAYSRSLF